MTTKVTKAIFIDAPALWFGARRGWQRRPDYGRLRLHLAGNDDLVSATVFLVDRIGIDPFEAALRHLGYNTLVVPTGQCCDSYIARAAMASEAQIITIAGGGGLYEPMIQELKAQGKTLQFHAFPANTPTPTRGWLGVSISPLGEEHLQDV